MIQAVQLPIFFKLGYTKARFMSIVPFALLMGAYGAFMMAARESGVLADVSAFLAGVLSNGVLTALLTVAVLALAVCVSYKLSVAFYNKREF